MLARCVLYPCVCPSRLSVCRKPLLYQNDLTDRAGFCNGCFLWPIVYSVLSRVGYLQNMRTLLWNFAPNSWIRKLCHGKSMVWSTKLVNGRACGLHLRRSSGSWWLDAQSLLNVGDCNLLTPLFRFVLNLLYNLFLHCYAAVGRILTDTSRCAVGALLNAHVLVAEKKHLGNYYPRESFREGLCNHRRWFLCLSVSLFVCYHDN